MQETNFYHSTPELSQLAVGLICSPYFVGPSELSRITDKQNIFLVLADEKPVAFGTSGHYEQTADGSRTVPDDPAAVGTFLTRLGLSYDLQSDEWGTDAYIAKTPDLVAEAIAAANSITIGHLFGYPKTAVTAFEKGDVMPIEAQLVLEQQAGLGEYTAPFRFSSSHWAAELELVKHWRDVLMRYGLL